MVPRYWPHFPPPHRALLCPGTKQKSHSRNTIAKCKSAVPAVALYCSLKTERSQGGQPTCRNLSSNPTKGRSGETELQFRSWSGSRAWNSFCRKEILIFLTRQHKHRQSFLSLKSPLRDLLWELLPQEGTTQSNRRQELARLWP